MKPETSYTIENREEEKGSLEQEGHSTSLRGLEDRIRRGTVKGNSVADVRFTAGQVMWRWMQSDLMQHLHCLEAKQQFFEADLNKIAIFGGLIGWSKQIWIFGGLMGCPRKI